ncbi:glycosyltransferase involved in cell wall biosynthesis [Edaphobacter aggregans]|uniref:Glycosyltransferase involved in cell wall biosynthesis n=1 Tax=Edaphobacter aggregans TaxID=570835 RepID=A0A428MK98_9BACT|nr:glycosyltransferase [Edaphobacter aggregans]RSL17328.1 glycosyltransferase involved in cell wall biosynthesis [Edaphobacter aggregans]
MRVPRVAYFPDSFHEVNGVAHTSRNFIAFAQRHRLPFLCVRAGERATAFEQIGELRTLELGRSKASVRMEKDLEFDALFWRHAGAIRRELKRFKPDVIHITGPSELGIFGVYFAWELNIPLVASWHTNVHEYAARRMAWLTRRLGERRGETVDQGVESGALWATSQFYKLARVLFAPNGELCRMLERSTDRPCYLMQRGVDTELFSPVRRTRGDGDEVVVLGYVGRLSVEKNVALLARVERELTAMGVSGVRFLIVGHGSEESALRAELSQAEFAGVLRGTALAEAYANMDLLVFPSHTDTFGNVVLEALASGVPAVVTPDGGPKFIVRDGETGFVVPDDGFSRAVAILVQDRARLEQMRVNARAYAMECSWDTVFERVYAGYETALQAEG